MKNRTLSIVFILALLISIVAEVQVIQVAKANFMPVPPKFTVQSPTNATYAVNTSVPLIVILNQTYVPFPNWTPVAYCNYSLDGVEKGNITQTQITPAPNGSVSEPYVMNWCTFNTTLSGLTEGSHNIEIFAGSGTGRTASGNVYFSVGSNAVPEFPSWVILPLFLIMMLLVAIEYKRKRP